MKRNWAILLAVLFVLGALAGERGSALYVRNLVAQREALQGKVDDALLRTLRGTREKAEYEALHAAVQDVTGKIHWESDSTNLLRWFTTSAAEVGARMTNSRIIPADRWGSVVGGGSLERMRFEVHLQGSYGPLVRYMECIESCRTPMLIESFVLQANRDRYGVGDLDLVVSCLSPAPQQGRAATGAGDHLETGVTPGAPGGKTSGPGGNT